MLTSITPLGERGRGQRWAITMISLFVGHCVGGLALGAILAGLGLATGAVLGTPDGPVAVGIVAAAAVMAAAFDIGGRALPGRRQVDEGWLTAYRGWVYGFGFGAQLGFGFVTVINTLLVVPLVLAGVLVGPTAAILLGGFYGMVRGLGAILGAGVRSVEQLRRLHRLIDSSERVVRIGGATAVAALSVGLAVVT